MCNSVRTKVLPEVLSYFRTKVLQKYFRTFVSYTATHYEKVLSKVLSYLRASYLRRYVGPTYFHCTSIEYFRSYEDCP